MTNPARMPWVDMAKGLSIILVVMTYSAYNTGEYTGKVGFLHYDFGALPLTGDRSALAALCRSANRALPLFPCSLGDYHDRPEGRHIWPRPGRDIAISVVQPYGVLWFIYMLGVFGIVAKLLWQFRVPHAVVILFAAALQMLDVEATSYLLTQFAPYVIFFYLG